MRQPIRIVLIHDQSLIREGLGRLLKDEPGFEVVGSCGSVSDALEALRQRRPHVVLIDYDLGEEQRQEFFKESKRGTFQSRILITMPRMSGAQVVRILEGGASGVVMRDSPPSDLVKAIHRVASGELWLDSETVKSIAEAVRSGEHKTWRPLDVRECAVLKAVLEGLTNRQIAAKLQIPESSVKYVVRRLFEKAGVKTRSQLVRTALETHAQDWLTTHHLR